MDLSREYDIQTVKDCCEAFMLLDVPTVALFVSAQDYELLHLLQKCIDHFSSMALFKIEEDPDYPKLSQENRLIILEGQRNTLQTFNLTLFSYFRKKKDSLTRYEVFELVIITITMRLTTIMMNQFFEGNIC